MLKKRCLEYEAPHTLGKPASVGEMRGMRPRSRPLPLYPVEMAKCSSVRVGAFRAERFAAKDYSVPCACVGRWVGVKAYPQIVEIYAKGEQISVNPRRFGKRQTAQQRPRRSCYARPSLAAERNAAKILRLSSLTR